MHFTQVSVAYTEDYRQGVGPETVIYSKSLMDGFIGGNILCSALWLIH